VRAQDDLAASQVALRDTMGELKDEQVEGMRSMQSHFGQLELLSGRLTTFLGLGNPVLTSPVCFD
jgi:hypothetical protein